MVLDGIKLQTTWNDAAGSLNSNFAKILQAITSLESSSEGLDLTQLAAYLEENGYATEEWIAEQGYLKSDALATVATSGSYTDLSNRPTSMKSPYALTINNSAGTAQVSYDGSATKSLTLTKSMVGLGNVANSTYAGGTAVTLNGTSKASSTASFYAPTSAGTSGQLLVSSGGAPSWVSKSSISLSAFTDDVVAGKYLPLSGGNVSSLTIGGNTAIHSGNIGSYNAGSATKLATARTIWGQSFDGTGKVQGDLSLHPTTQGDNQNSGRLRFHTLAGRDTSPYIQGISVSGGYTKQRIGFFQTNASSYTPEYFEAMSILPNGNVGIGTTSPAYKLDVAGSVGISGNLTVGGHILPTAHNTYAVGQQNKGYAFVYANVLASGASDNNLWLVGGNSTDSIGIVFARNATGAATSAVGRWSAVGLYPEATNTLVLGQSSNRWSTIYGVKGDFTGNLSVTGTVTIGGQTTISNNLIVSGDTATGSDIRYKDVIEDRTIDIRAMADAPLFTFTWNDRSDDKVHLGTSAQYWERVAPWLVKGEDFKHLDYSTLGVAMAVSLAKKTVDIEERVKVLEKENKVLKEELRRIRNGAIC